MSTPVTPIPTNERYVVAKDGLSRDIFYVLDRGQRSTDPVDVVADFSMEAEAQAWAVECNATNVAVYGPVAFLPVEVEVEVEHFSHVDLRGRTHNRYVVQCSRCGEVDQSESIMWSRSEGARHRSDHRSGRL